MSEEESNGPGFHYLISYTRATLRQQLPEFKQVVRDVHQGSLVANVSESFLPYMIYVQAVNDEGFAPTDRLHKIIGFSGEGSK